MIQQICPHCGFAHVTWKCNRALKDQCSKLEAALKEADQVLKANGLTLGSIQSLIK